MVRDACLFIAIAAVIAIAAINAQQQIRDNQVLLYIPFASTLFFFVYATNDHAIAQIRRYILDHILAEKRESDGNSRQVAFGWEYVRRRGTLSRVFSRIARFSALWVTFSGASLVSLAATLPDPSDYAHSIPWLGALFFAALPYVFAVWLLDWR